ncbi:hypothetical protein TIFTF001_006524 [Ficus carica]|uniref:Protein kinase domain-containing protein n=1 Tax=Ficus carica TaxID=3494 RepID=A0AA88ABG1_FICCA|nr:hypothetical protein TIFTF001_006524 [Ficus carica]
MGLAQGDSGNFISIDCGISDRSSYTDETTGIYYLSDTNFTETGENREVWPEYKLQTKIQQFWNVRSFPEGNRNCYVLKPVQGKDTRYLIRAWFMYGNYDNNNHAPVFDLYLGVDLWDTINFDFTDSQVDKEIIHVPSSDHIYVCLVNTGYGVPFISALELRPLGDQIYKSASGTALQLFGRYDFGTASNEATRYADDVYDRLWSPFAQDSWTAVNNSITNKDFSRLKNIFELPLAVLTTAYTLSGDSNKTGNDMGIQWKSVNLTSKYYLYMHFTELQELGSNQSRSFNIFINGNLGYGHLVLQKNSITTIFSSSFEGYVTPDSEGKIQVWFNKTENSTLPPLINAMEIYTLHEELSQQETNENDVEAILNIKSIYEVKRNWQGDPCAPKAFLWGGINCSYDANNPSRIISLDLSSSGLKGEISPYIANLTMIQILDLSNNSLNGKVPENLAELASLRVFTDINLNPCPSGSCGNKNNKKFIIPVVASVGGIVLLTVLIWCHRSWRKARKDSSANILSWEDRLRMAIDTAQGLEYLHNGCKPPIVHRDVKSTNILLNEKLQAKLSDFGLSKIFPNEGHSHFSTSSASTLGISTSVVGTPGYLDPEYYETNWLNEKSDVYSFGVVLLEIITGQPVLTKTRENKYIIQWVSSIIAKGDIRKILDPRIQGDFDVNTVWRAVEIAMACVEPSSRDRPTMSRVAMELKECLTTELSNATRKDVSKQTTSRDYSVEINSSNPLVR